MTAARNNIAPLTTGITHNIERVTPVMAARWIEKHNSNNRTISKSRVAGYAAEMAAGRWTFNGETIQFDRDGVMLNGQHRCQAIIETGLTQTFLIVRGLDPQTQVTMDQGTRRAPHEQLMISGVAADSTVAAAIRVYLQWRTGRLFGDQIRNRIGTGEVVQFALDNPGHVDRLRTLNVAATRRIFRTPSITLAVALRLYEIDDYDAGVFLHGLSNGADLPSDSPILALRNRFLKAETDHVRLNIRDVIGMFITAWNAFREGRSLQKMQRPKGGTWTIENFPEPK